MSNLLSITSYIACADGDLRLVGGFIPSEGRVEICINNTYGTICDDRWDEQDAAVVCTQLQFSPNGMFSLLTCIASIPLPYIAESSLRVYSPE